MKKKIPWYDDEALILAIICLIGAVRFFTIAIFGV